MADDTAHVPPGPQSDGATATLADDPPHQGAADVPSWSFAVAAVEPEESPAPPPGNRDQAELPLAPPTPAAPPAARAQQPLFGPVGRPRSALLVPVLSAVTLGVYALVWHKRVNREMEEFDPKLHARPVRSALAVAVPWLIGLLTSVAGAALVITSRLNVHLPFDPHITAGQGYYLLAGLLAIPYLTLLLPFSLVAVVMTLERLRSVEEHLGVTTDRQVRPVATALLLALPLFGGLALLGLEQRRLNAIWDAVAPTGRGAR